MFDLRGRTRENPISRAQLAVLGITPQSTATALASGRRSSWVCVDGPSLVGFSTGDNASGEILVVAVAPEFEANGIGKRLLRCVVDALRSRGCRRLWLAASADPRTRSHGFYRHLGWRPSGGTDANGDEILDCPRDPSPERQ
jgi:GNAT superfamily N-acetyltransferase